MEPLLISLHFKVRACEHLGNTHLTGKTEKNPKESVVFDHIVHTGHNASFDDFETLVKECDEFRLLLRESLLVFPDDPPLNRYVKSVPLEHIDLILFHNYLKFSFII